MANLNDLKYNQCAVYMIVNPIGQKYVGASTNICKRYLQYKNKECKTQNKLINSIELYGFDAHEFVILELISKKDIKQKEHDYGILHEVLTANGLNSVLPKCKANFKTVSEDRIQKGRLYKPTKETLIRMSIAQKGRVVTEETRKKLRLANIGKKQSDITKDKKNKKLRGLKRSEQTKIKLSNSKKGTKISEELKEKLRLINTGRPMSDETKRKISESNKGKKISNHTKQRLKESTSKIIIDLETGVFYNSATELANIIKMKRTTLTAKLSGQNINNTQYKYC